MDDSLSRDGWMDGWMVAFEDVMGWTGLVEKGETTDQPGAIRRMTHMSLYCLAMLLS